MDSLHPALQYCQDVLSGQIVTGKYVKLAVQRHLDDLATGPSRGLYFDAKAAQRVIDFFHLLRHHKGEWAGQPVVLEPWQQFYIWCLYGWKRTDGTRRFRSCYLAVARKNGKTTLSAGKALYALIADSEPGAQVYTVATKEDQARIAFDDASFIIDKTPSLKKVVKVFTKSITYQENSFVKPLGSDSKRQDGFDPSYAIIDEYHAHPDASMLDVIESGTGARRQPMIDIITTAGYNQQGPCFKLERVIKEILEGKKQDDSQFGMIFALDEEDTKDPEEGQRPAWENPALWVKANPNLGISPKIPFMMDRLKKAQNEGGDKQVDFLTKNLNVWTQSAKTWIQDTFWLACTKNGMRPGQFKGRTCFGGLDLASRVDIAAFSLFFPLDEDSYFNGKPVKFARFGWYFVPEDSANRRSNKDKVSYLEWIKDGWVFGTPGNVTDYNFIKKTILDLGSMFNIVSIGYDPWNSSQLVIDLIEEGATMSEFRQGFHSLSTPTKEYEKLILGGELITSEDPVIRWMLGNVSIRRDPAGNMKPDKEKSQEKIDGIVSDIIALGEYLSDDSEGESIYERRGILGV
jgi:phage terminase large subunit-like protein